MKVSIKPTNINSQLESLFEFFRPECDKKKIKLEIFPGLDNNAAGIQTDPEKLYAILANLIKNAIKYTPKGSIEYGYTHEDSMIHFYVNDTGEGIKSDRLDSIFERFVREDNSDIDSKQGSGLGLSIVKGYVELLDGEIWVESEKGKGSSFHFTIPDKFSAEESKRSEPVVASKEDRINTLSNKTILIVEDDEISFDFLEIVIRSFGVKNILLAKDGNESVRLCKENQSIDLVLMDINLPGISGYDATKAIRKFNRDLPIISQTAYAISGDRKRSMEAGCNDYISKPIKKEDLLEKLEKFLFKD
jgi:CheY-like chemotaxis protein